MEAVGVRVGVRVDVRVLEEVKVLVGVPGDIDPVVVGVEERVVVLVKVVAGVRVSVPV